MDAISYPTEAVNELFDESGAQIPFSAARSFTTVDSSKTFIAAEALANALHVTAACSILANRPLLHHHQIDSNAVFLNNAQPY